MNGELNIMTSKERLARGKALTDQPNVVTGTEVLWGGESLWRPRYGCDLHQSCSVEPFFFPLHFSVKLPVKMKLKVGFNVK